MMKRRIATLGTLATGVIAGGVMTMTMSANAATPTHTPTAAPSGYAAGSAPNGTAPTGLPPRGHAALSHSGTVTAVGSSSVTIKEASGTHTYQVTSASDIDRNGEATLSDLKVGDAVTFSLNGTTIDKLHSGDEAKNRPTGQPPMGTRPSGHAPAAAPR